VLDLDVRSGSLAALHGRSVALSTQQARKARLHVGDHVKVALGDGTHVSLSVVATYARSLGFGEFVLPRELAAPHATDPLATAVLVHTAPGASVASVRAGLRKVAAAHPGVRVSGKAALRSDEDQQREIRLWINRVLAGLIFAFTAIAAVNTLAMISLSRGRELALLRLVGATPRQLARMAHWEAGLVVIIGIGLGAAIAGAALLPISQALTGSPMPDLDPGLLAGILGGTAVLGLVATLAPTRLALRTRAVDAIGMRE
jgi:putative ABC transport system permease protein